MLEPYIEKYETYLAYAFSICRCNDLKNDLVNEMFLKLHSILEDDPSKEISNGYIYMMIKSIYLNQIRDKKEYVFDNYVFEAEAENESVERREMMADLLDNLGFFHREILYKCSELSIRDLAKEIGCSKGVIQHHKGIAMNLIKEIANGKT